MKTIKLLLVFSVLLLIIQSSVATINAVDREEGGYVGGRGQGDDVCVYNFLKHFSYEQYYWGYKHQWSTNNNNRVDSVDFAIFSHHGGNWSIKLLDGWLSLASAGNSSHKGYGDLDCEFVAFQACQVIPSPWDVSDWHSKWISEPDDVFDGLHQALGFRTNASFATDQDITNIFGWLIKLNFGVWESWFTAIDVYGGSSEMGSAVMHPSCDGDTYGNYAPDPPETSTWLRIWWQY